MLQALLKHYLYPLTAGITARGQIHLSNQDGSIIKLSGDNVSEIGAKAQSSTTAVQSAI